MATLGNLNSEYEQKDNWSLLPTEIKQKIVKYVPLRTRIGIKRVCKQWLDIVVDLNIQESKMVFIEGRGQSELPYDANSVCNLTRHAFDRTSVMHFPREMDRRSLVKNFPNLVAVHFSLHYIAGIGGIVKLFKELEHFSFTGLRCQIDYTSFDTSRWSCLQDKEENSFRNSTLPPPKPGLKFFNGLVWTNDLFREMLKRGVVGYSMKLRQRPRFALMKQFAMDTEILYDLDLEDNVEIVEFLSQFPKLSTIYARGGLVTMAALKQLTSLTKLSWVGNGRMKWTDDNVLNALMSFGHRLRSLRIGLNLNVELLINAVVKSCPNLVELHVFQMAELDSDRDDFATKEFNVQRIIKRNSFREFRTLKELAKLKTLSINFEDVDMKFVRTFSPEIPEVGAIGEASEWPMTIKQLIRQQFEIVKLKSTAMAIEQGNDAKDKRIRDLESQLAKFQQS